MRLKQRSIFEDSTAGEFWFEIILGIVAVGYGTINAMKADEDPAQAGYAQAYFYLTAVAAIAVFFRAKARNKKARKEYDASPLEAVLYTLHSMLKLRTDAAGQASLRVCVHVPGRKPETSYQLTHYVGDDAGDGMGRCFPLRIGVVGKAFRTGCSQFAKMPSNQRLSEFLIDQHGFLPVEAVNVKEDRTSWAAIPVGNPGKVVAVIFLDCNQSNFFGRAGSTQRKMLESAIEGVAKFVKRN